jgi:RNA polymerase sigma-70 factor (ECF subfamily)
VTERFLAAAFGGDLTALMEILAPEVTLWGDGGGKAQGARDPRPLRGRDKVARLITTLGPRFGSALDAVYRNVNGDPSALLFAGGRAGSCGGRRRAMMGR